jgi:hypothetical protein
MHLNYNLGVRSNDHSSPKKSYSFIGAWVRSLDLYQFILYFIFVYILFLFASNLLTIV